MLSSSIFVLSVEQNFEIILIKIQKIYYFTRTPIIGSFRFGYEYDYEIRQAKRMLYAYAIPYWREKVVAVAHLSTKLWRSLVVLTTTFQKNKESWLIFVFQK
jgi:hypothetical protein